MSPDRETITRLWPICSATDIAFRAHATPKAVRRIAAELGLGPSPFTKKPTRAEKD
jgi:hypothetical protein